MRPVYLLDTNVISEFGKSIPNLSVLRKIKEKEELCAICSTVWQESVYGLKIMPEGRRKEVITKIIDYIRGTFDIIPYDSFASQICGEIRVICKEAGKPAPFYDSQIAATAIANNMILITHNKENYEPLLENSMLRIEDWWE